MSATSGSMSGIQKKSFQASNIEHYKPQELIRLEIEKNQLKSENETMQGFTEELKKKVDHLTNCIKESNSNIFLKE